MNLVFHISEDGRSITFESTLVIVDYKRHVYSILGKRINEKRKNYKNKETFNELFNCRICAGIVCNDQFVSFSGEIDFVNMLICTFAPFVHRLFTLYINMLNDN